MPFDIRKEQPRPRWEPPKTIARAPIAAWDTNGEDPDTRRSLRTRRSRRSPKWHRLLGTVIIFLVISGAVVYIVRLERQLRSGAEEAVSLVRVAAEALRAGDFGKATRAFDSATGVFHQGNEQLMFVGPMIELGRFVPGVNKAYSGKHLFEAGERLTRAGSLAIPLLQLTRGVSHSGNGADSSVLDTVRSGGDLASKILTETNAAYDALTPIDPLTLPLSERAIFLQLRSALPTVQSILRLAKDHASVVYELLGGNGPRKYLFLFENNHELRATGGFIGSYALLDMSDGRVRRFFVDGIFNPDGQLRANIVPPEPIQKISAGWSLHDSNWFPDFPRSAEKAISFYEKTGGPTVDGVIAITPVILERLLMLSGPITLPEYGVTIDEENFMPLIQSEVEEKYDRTENNPKKILGDLTGVMLGRLFGTPDLVLLQQLAEILSTGLNERQILLYARHPETEALIDAAGWSGRILETSGDYLSVIHSNINGYKTDGVIDETIRHSVEIGESGSVVDTVTITREHRGGGTPYAWWNKVSADYLRVYVPLGSELLSAEGMTREIVEPPLDYAVIGFSRDPDVVAEESAIRIDPETGTRIGVDAGKTVFGNWVYVSPHESVTVRYRYRLPFTVDIARATAESPAKYSVLYQKQAGTERVSLQGELSLPEQVDAVWQSGENLIPYARSYRYSSDFDRNRFYAWVLQGTSKK